MDFTFFQPTISQTVAFSAIVVFVVFMVLWIARRSFPKVNIANPATFLAGWMLLHLFLGKLEVLRSDTMPPPLLFYMLFTFGVGIYFSFSKWGKQIALNTPIRLLVFLQIFGFPLELILASLAGNGNIPSQMTYGGFNFDIITGLGAIFILMVSRGKVNSRIRVLALEHFCIVFLTVIAVVAALSSPIPIRAFHDGPPLVLAMFAPWNWIVSVCVFFAIVGHLITFRILWSRRGGKNA